METSSEQERRKEKYNLINAGKSHTIISPAIGCRHSCVYCNGKRNSYQENYSSEEVIYAIKNSQKIIKDESSLLFYGYSDPFLDDNCDGLIKILKNLESLGWKNRIGLITKINPPSYVLDIIANLTRLKPAVLVSYANMIPGIESPPAEDRLKLMKGLFERRVPVVCYLSPLVKEWSPPRLIEELLLQVRDTVNAIAISGIILTDQIASELIERNVVVPQVDNVNTKYEDNEYFDYVEELFKSRTNIPIFRSGFKAISFLQP